MSHVAKRIRKNRLAASMVRFCCCCRRLRGLLNSIKKGRLLCRHSEAKEEQESKRARPIICMQKKKKRQSAAKYSPCSVLHVLGDKFVTCLLLLFRALRFIYTQEE